MLSGDFLLLLLSNFFAEELEIYSAYTDYSFSNFRLIEGISVQMDEEVIKNANFLKKVVATRGIEFIESKFINLLLNRCTTAIEKLDYMSSTYDALMFLANENTCGVSKLRPYLMTALASQRTSLAMTSSSESKEISPNIQTIMDVAEKFGLQDVVDQCKLTFEGMARREMLDFNLSLIVSTEKTLADR